MLNIINLTRSFMRFLWTKKDYFLIWVKFSRDALKLFLSSCQLTLKSVCKPYLSQSFGTCHYSWVCPVRSTKHWSLPVSNIQVPNKAENSLSS